MEVKFLSISQVEDALLRYAVIAARFEDKWVFVRHKMRDTYEIPGGHREAEEDIISCAKRELYEETGALSFSLTPVCIYGVVREKMSYGLLCFAQIKEMGPLPAHEIGEVELFDALPLKLTYPEIQPALLKRAGTFWEEIREEH